MIVAASAGSSTGSIAGNPSEPKVTYVAVGTDGTAYATDTNNMDVVRLKRGATALEVWVGAGAFGPTGVVLDGISVLGKGVYVNTLVTSKLFTIPNRVHRQSWLTCRGDTRSRD
jgi:hypothetical protein